MVPAGTKVVVRKRLEDPNGELIRPEGAVGVIVEATQDHIQTYRVRFPSNEEATLKRSQFQIKKFGQKEDIATVFSEEHGFDLTQFIIYRCVVGSRAQGLNNEESDIDRRGVYLPPAELHWSIHGVPEQLENQETQEFYWELQKFLLLALKGNPTILECLYTPMVEMASPVAQELLSIRDIFLSRLIYQTYMGYSMSQFKKIEQDLRNQGSIKWKHAMHLIRTVLSGITALREGRLRISADEHAEKLLMIRRGEMPWKDVNAWLLKLYGEFDTAYEKTDLPVRPDYRVANDFLVRARRTMV